jgi:hypothetical protein
VVMVYWGMVAGAQRRVCVCRAQRCLKAF